MQKIHTHTSTQNNKVLEFPQVVEPFDECQKGNILVEYKRISRIWSIVAMDQPIWKSKCRRGIMRL